VAESRAADTNERNNPRRDVLVITAICLVGLSVQLLVLSAWAATPLFLFLTGDELNFHRTALGLIGQGPPVDAFLYQPLYSFYLAGLYRLFGVDIAMVRTVQLLFGTGTILLCYGLGREIGGRAAGIWAAFFAAFYGPLVFFETQLLAPAIKVPFCIASFWLLLRAGKRDQPWLLLPAGLLFGLAMMARPNLAVCLPIAALWLWYQSADLRRRLAGLALALLGLGVGLAPSWIHNVSQGDVLTAVSSAGGISFYIGNNPQATGAYHAPYGEHIDPTSHGAYRASLEKRAEADAGRALSPSEISSYWYKRGFQFWLEEPGHGLILLGKKLLLAVNDEERSIHYTHDFGREISPLLGYLLTFGVLFPFAVMGAVIGWRRHRGVGLLIGCAGAYTVTLVVYYVCDRYRLMLLPMLWPLAGLGAAQLTEYIGNGSRRRVTQVLLVLGLAFALTQIPLVSDSTRLQGIVSGYNLMGKAEAEHGRLDQAEVYFQKAVRLAGPNHGIDPRNNLGLVLEKRGDPSGARMRYREVIKIDPGNAFALRRLADLAEQQGDFEEALTWWERLAGVLDDPAPARSAISQLKSQLQALPPAGNQP
jgi:4-amino-4-deoxy-L-arabinose transferase-like glycosyltransferase